MYGETKRFHFIFKLYRNVRNIGGAGGCAIIPNNLQVGTDIDQTDLRNTLTR